MDANIEFSPVLEDLLFKGKLSAISVPLKSNQLKLLFQVYPANKNWKNISLEELGKGINKLSSPELAELFYVSNFLKLKALTDSLFRSIVLRIDNEVQIEQFVSNSFDKGEKTWVTPQLYKRFGIKQARKITNFEAAKQMYNDALAEKKKITDNLESLKAATHKQPYDEVLLLHHKINNQLFKNEGILYGLKKKWPSLAK